MRHHHIDKYAGTDGPVHRLDPRVKIVSFFGLVIICVSTPPEAIHAFFVYLALILGILIASKVPIGYVFLRSLVVIPFVIVIAVFIPFLKPADSGGAYIHALGGMNATRSGLMIFWNVLIKSYIGVLSVVLLSVTTPFPKLLNGFEQLKVPKVLVMLAGFSHRYLFILVDEVIRMKRARDSRCWGGKWLWQAGVIGQMIGTLFLRCYERGERVYQAMIARGFDGTRKGITKTSLYGRDYFFATVVLGFPLLIRIVIRS